MYMQPWVFSSFFLAESFSGIFDKCDDTAKLLKEIEALHMNLHSSASIFQGLIALNNYDK